MFYPQHKLTKRFNHGSKKLRAPTFLFLCVLGSVLSMYSQPTHAGSGDPETPLIISRYTNEIHAGASQPGTNATKLSDYETDRDNLLKQKENQSVPPRIVVAAIYRYVTKMRINKHSIYNSSDDATRGDQVLGSAAFGRVAMGHKGDNKQYGWEQSAGHSSGGNSSRGGSVQEWLKGKIVWFDVGLNRLVVGLDLFRLR